MEFRIPGPLEVRRDRRAVAVPGGKPRAVLAVLLLHANEPVNAERLAVALWGEDAPAGAIRTVQVYLSRLRRALGENERLTTSRAGYRLRVRAGELDRERFERLVEDGRRALAEGRAEQAGRLLREALARPAAGRSGVRTLRARGDRAPGGTASRGCRGPRGSGSRRCPARRAGARAAATHRRAPAARTPARPADARALP